MESFYIIVGRCKPSTLFIIYTVKYTDTKVSISFCRNKCLSISFKVLPLIQTGTRIRLHLILPQCITTLAHACEGNVNKTIDLQTQTSLHDLNITQLQLSFIGGATFNKYHVALKPKEICVPEMKPRKGQIRPPVSETI